MHKEEIERNHDKIRKLEEELTDLFNEKKAAEDNLCKQVLELEKEVSRLDEELEQKGTELEEMSFTLNGILMQK